MQLPSTALPGTTFVPDNRYFYIVKIRGFVIDSTPPSSDTKYVELTKKEYDDLFEGQSKGFTIVPDEANDNKPTLVKIEATDEQVLARVRKARNRLLLESDYMDTAGFAARSSEEKLKECMEYRQALFDITKQPDIRKIVWPVKPE